MLNAKPVDTPMYLGVKLVPNQGELYSKFGRYKKLVAR